MITLLKLHNFQIHHSRVFKLLPGVNVFVGPSNAGKSSVVRALGWLFLNQPGGVEFVSFGAPICMAVLEVDGRVLKRARGKDTNTYSLDGKVFKAFGSGVPEQVSSLLNCGEDNFQFQFDPVFWFSRSPGEVGRALNSVVNLSVMDLSLQESASRLRSCKERVRVCEERLSSSRKELQALAWVEEAEQEYSKIEALLPGIASSRSTIESLKSTLLGLKKATDAAGRASKRIVDGSKVVEAGEKVLTLSETVGELSSLLQDIRKQEELACRSSEQAAQKEKQLRERVPNCPLCGSPFPPKRKS